MIELSLSFSDSTFARVVRYNWHDWHRWGVLVCPQLIANCGVGKITIAIQLEGCRYLSQRIPELQLEIEDVSIRVLGVGCRDARIVFLHEYF